MFTKLNFKTMMTITLIGLRMQLILFKQFMYTVFELNTLY